MSFFDDVLGSIGTGKSPAPPVPPSRSASSKSVISRPKSEGERPALGIAQNSAVIAQNGTKRKAESDLRRNSEKSVKSSLLPGSTNTFKVRPSPAPLPASTNSQVVLPNPGEPSTINGIASIPGPASKAPPKGSFADIIARAKALQGKTAGNQVGMIKHQAASKEKISRMAVKKREDEERVQAQKHKLARRPADNGRIEKRRSTSPVKKKDEPRIPKAPRPPLSAPNAPAPIYKGTMGMPGRRPPPSREKSSRRSSRYDEYLGTDEEDEMDEMEDDKGEGSGSDASSDMEAGLEDIDVEESRALKQAKEDDAKEIALENKLKREKEERRKKLQAMADRRR